MAGANPIKMASHIDNLNQSLYLEAEAKIVRAMHAPNSESFDDLITEHSPEWMKETCVAEF